jgi:hypothetical protein
MTHFDQDEILKSIDKHMGSLKDTVKSALVAAIIFWWAGLNREDPIKIFGMTIPLDFALYFAIVFYLFINLSVLEKLTRIGNLLRIINDDNLIKAISQISLYSFFANPFSYFGNSLSSRVTSSKGFGVLIVIWWVCNSSLYSLSKNSMTFTGLLLQGMFLVIGIASMIMINMNSSFMLNRVKTINTEFYNELDKIEAERSIVTFICIGIGGVFAYITMLMSNR